MNKYHAKRTLYRGEWYDSKAEANYAGVLELQRRAREISAWRRGFAHILASATVLGREYRATYKPDFLVTKLDGSVEAIDVKGVLAPSFKIKWILWMERYAYMPLRAVDRDGRQVWPKEKKR